MATSKSMRIAAVQFYTEKDTEKNWERTEVYIKKAAADKVDLIIFPEFFLVSDAAQILVKPLERFAALAQKYKVDIVTGTYGVKDPADGKFYNCCSYVDWNGKVLYTYRKVHLWIPERKLCTPGKHFGTVTNRFGIKIGLCVCWDIAFNDGFTEMALNQGAELIIAPALWCLEDAGFVGLAYDPDSERKLVNAMCTARAFENEIVMVFVNGSASPRYYGTVDPANDMVLPSNFGTLAGQTQIAVPFKGAVSRCNHYYEEMIVQNVDVGRLTRDAEKVYQIRSDWAIKKAAKL